MRPLRYSIDVTQYEIVVHPRLAGHGPTSLAGLSRPVDPTLVSRMELGSGAVAMRYVPRDVAVGRRPPP